MVKRLLAKHLPTIVLAATLAGCGVAPPPAAPPAGGAAVFRSAPSEQAVQDALADAHAVMGPEFQQFLTSLALTDAQKASFKALIKERLQAKLPELKEQAQQLKALLLAEPFDAAALKTALESMHQAHLTALHDKVVHMSAMRDVLTAVQQATVAAYLESMNGVPERKKAFLQRFGQQVADQLELTDTQRQAHSALQELKLAYMDRMARMAHPAMAQFMKDGDEAALEATLRSGIEEPPFDQGVAFLATLTPAQRTKMVSIVKELIKAHKPLFEALMN